MNLGTKESFLEMNSRIKLPHITKGKKEIESLDSRGGKRETKKTKCKLGFSKKDQGKEGSSKEVDARLRSWSVSRALPWVALSALPDKSELPLYYVAG